MITIAAPDLPASTAFYRAVFGWSLTPASPTRATVVLSSGPVVTLRGDASAGAQGVVPFVAVPDVPEAVAALTSAGATVDGAPWTLPTMGTLARIADPWGTVYGLASAPGGMAAPPHVPAPFGAAPRPPAHTVCSLELYAGDLEVVGRFVGEHWGWGTLPTMPQYLMFDPGAGIGGVFQSHTPASRGVAYLYAPDVAATLDAIEGAGGHRMGDPMAMPGMATFGYFSDPSGTMMGLIGG
jgi:predicted enzyme related to lactoylglutathione lyase